MRLPLIEDPRSAVWQRKTWLIVLALVLAFGFLGARGIWDPDEGRYTNVALTMLDSGNWIDPMRSDDIGHWTKPPVTYWLIAASVAVFGQTPWAARLPVALAYLACMWLVWRITRHLAYGSEPLAVVVYATMLLPFGAGHLVTTDFVLAAFQALAMYGFVLFRFDLSRPPQHGLALMWLGFALGFMRCWCRCRPACCCIGWCHGRHPATGAGILPGSRCFSRWRCRGLPWFRSGTMACWRISWVPKWWTASPAIVSSAMASGMAG